MSNPSHRICAIVDEREDAGQALDALIKTGSKEEEIEILYGREGIDLLNPKDTGHGFFPKIVKKIQSFGEIGKMMIRRYESALRQGRYVFVVPAYTDHDQETIRRSLRNGKAREINSFSSWYVESI